MEEETLETRNERDSAWRASHPWLAGQSDGEEDDVDEVIRYTLDEIRFS